MLLLVTILLVAVGTISLIFGFVQSSLLPIYISIACSVLAAVVLLIFSRMTAKSQQVVTADGPAPLDTAGPDRRDDRTAPVPAFSGTGLLEGSSSGESFAPDDRHGSSSRFGAADDERDELDDVRPADTDVADDDFPIERYDSRRVGEILPLLAELDLDELDIVREHEEQGKSRATVLARIDQLIDQLEAEDRQEAASRFDDEPVGAPSFSSAATDEPDAADDDDLGDLAVPVAATPAPPLPTQAVTVAALPEDDGYFPIEDYDDLRASEILPLLPELDDDELVMVQDRERSTAARSSILRRIEALLLDAPESGAAPPEPEPVATFAPEPEPVATFAPEPAPPAMTEVPAKKAPSRRVPAARKTTPAKAPAKKATVIAPAKKAPVAKKAPAAKVARKSAATGQAASPGPVKKTAAKAGKAAVAKKVPTEKVASARAAAASKGGGTASAKAAKATKTTRKTTKG